MHRDQITAPNFESIRQGNAVSLVSAIRLLWRLVIEGDPDAVLLHKTQTLERKTLVAPLFKEASADPGDPSEGHAVLWMSDGTGTGDDGDIMVKITAGGATKTTTLLDFSTL